MEALTTPYSPPEGELVADRTGFNTPKFLSFSGRIGRLRYLAYGTAVALLTWLTMAALVIPLGMLAGSDGMLAGFTGAIFLLSVPSIIFSFAFAIRRLNDLNQSGWLSLLMLVPVVNLGLSLFLIFARGTDGPNNYGLPPPPNTKGVIALSVTMPVFFALIGILAAIAIPAYQGYVARAAAQQGTVAPTSDATDASDMQTAADADASSENATAEEGTTEESTTEETTTEDSAMDDAGDGSAATESEAAAEQ